MTEKGLAKRSPPNLKKHSVSSDFSHQRPTLMAIGTDQWKWCPMPILPLKFMILICTNIFHTLCMHRCTCLREATLAALTMISSGRGDNFLAEEGRLKGFFEVTPFSFHGSLLILLKETHTFLTINLCDCY